MPTNLAPPKSQSNPINVEVEMLKVFENLWRHDPSMVQHFEWSFVIAYQTFIFLPSLVFHPLYNLLRITLMCIDEWGGCSTNPINVTIEILWLLRTHGGDKLQKLHDSTCRVMFRWWECKKPWLVLRGVVVINICMAWQKAFMSLCVSFQYSIKKDASWDVLYPTYK